MNQIPPVDKIIIINFFCYQTKSILINQIEN